MAASHECFDLTGLRLDGLALENVVFLNSYGAYRGESIQLENVSFVECDFLLDSNDASVAFVDAVVASLC
jgi:hypothetical protein